MNLRNEFRSPVLALIITVAMLLMVVGSGFAQSAGDCQDAAGGPIPCPATSEPPPDRDGDGVPDFNDACPDQSGPSANNGCAPVLSTPTSEPSTNPTNQPNPLRPPADGVCQVSAATTLGTNVRAQPSLSAPQVALLDPLQLYVVFNIVLNSEGTWYRVEAGWVNSVAVTLGGQCPVRIVAVGPTGFSIPQEAYDQTMAGIIFPETKCFEIFNGMRLCQTVLSAVADDGSTDGTVPWNVTTCGFGPGGVVCILNELTAFTEDECLPEFCEPPPSDPLPPGWPNPEGEETEGQAGSCEALLNDLAAASGKPHYRVFQPDGSTTIGLSLPPVDPEPCRQNIYLPREENAANGLIPIDVLAVEIDLPPGAEIDIESWSLGDQSSTTAGHVKVFSGNNDYAGSVCIALIPGDFRHCPDQPAAPLDLAAARTPEPPISVGDLFASMPPDPGTAYICLTDPEDINCYCDSDTDCADLFANACFGETMLCEGEICGCSYPNDPD